MKANRPCASRGGFVLCCPELLLAVVSNYGQQQLRSQQQILYLAEMRRARDVSWFRRMASYFREEVVESVQSDVSGRLEVWLVYGHYELNAPGVNYSFGKLHRVFESAFRTVQLRERRVKRALILGLGAGSVASLVAEQQPGCIITGVELDPVVVELGRKYFSLNAVPHLHIIQQDAATYMQDNDQKFDLLVVDLFVDEVVPEAAEKKVFLDQLKNALAPGGLLLFNRLMHTAALAEATERFTNWFMAALPGADYFSAEENRILRYAAPGEAPKS